MAMAQDAARVSYLWVDGAERSVVEGQLRTGGRAARVSDRFAVASTGKAVLAVAVLQLHERGVLDVQQLAAQWLPGDVIKAFGGMRGINIAHLLQMRSGLPDYYSDAYLNAVLDDPRNQDIDVALGFATGERRRFKPGRRFDYSNTNYLLAQLILERASGLTMAQYYRKHIFGPAGMGHTFVFGNQPLPGDFVQGMDDLGDGPEDVTFYYRGQGFGDGPLISSASDMAAFYRALFIERLLIGKASLAMMLEDPMQENYGMGVEVETLRGLGTVIGHSGGDLGFSADIRYAPDLDAIAVVLVAEPDADVLGSYDMLRELAR